MHKRKSQEDKSAESERAQLIDEILKMRDVDIL